MLLVLTVLTQVLTVMALSMTVFPQELTVLALLLPILAQELRQKGPEPRTLEDSMQGTPS